ncbi:phospholipid carrier-dependent glycosyltransferase [Candidatus Parcubacteria bacterium]|nr:MAG: phospholipid carrier-dependent glycosyltransferase [Candidatus Parcubacteria bacterium]
MQNKARLLILIFIFLIAFILRFYKLGEVPFGFYQDESAIGYNAYSIIETGKDEYGENLPLYFKSFGDYKLPVYIYLDTIPIKLFGLNEFAVRFPSAFFGFLSVVVFYFFVKEFTRDKNLSLVAVGLFALNPWSLHYNRATFEVSISLFLFLLGGLILQKAFNGGSKGKFASGTLLFIISLYSYNLTRLLSPAFYLLLLILNIKKIKNISKTEIIITSFISVVMLVPFVKTLLASGGISSASGTLIFSSASVLAPMIELRSYFVDVPLSKFFFNTPELIFIKYLQNIISYFSPAFFFISGSSHGNHGIGNIGQLYLFEFPLVILGLIKIVKEKSSKYNLFIFWALIVIMAASLTREAPHATRSFFLISSLEVFSALGVLILINWAKSIKPSFLKIGISLIFVGFLFYNLIYYFYSYYVRFPIYYAKAWRLADKEVSLYIKENEHKYSKIIFDSKAGFMYSSLLFYSRFNPSEFQGTVQRLPDDSEGFSKVQSFGKYEFKDIDWSSYDKPGEKVLYVTTTEGKPLEVPPLKAVYYPKKPVVFSLGQEIIQFPIEEIAYVLVEKK